MKTPPPNVKNLIWEKTKPFLPPLSILLIIAGGMHLSDLVTKVRHHQNLAEFESQLRSGNFIPLSQDAAIRDTLSIQLQQTMENSAPTLNGYEADALIETCVQALHAYHDGLFESYAQFRFPSLIHQNQGMTPEFKQDMALYMADFLAHDTTRPLVEQESSLPNPSSYERFLETDYHSYLVRNPQTSTTRYCTNCWSEIDLDSIRFQLNYFTQDVGTVRSLITDANSFGTVGQPANSYIHPSPRTVLERRGSILSAYVQWTIQTTPPEEVLPIFLHLYWIEEYGEWIPYELIVASEKGTDLFLHF